MKTLSVQLGPQHLLLKTTKPNSINTAKKKKTIKKSSKTETSKSKEPKTQRNPLNHNTPLVVKSIKSPPSQKKPSSTRPHSLYKPKIPTQNKKKQKQKPNPNPNQNLLVQQPKTHKKIAKPRMETTSWKMNLSKCNKPKNKKNPTNRVVIF
jgi:hypothetical protein